MQTDCQPKAIPLSTHQHVPPVTPASIRAAILACNIERCRVSKATGIFLPLVPVPVDDSAAEGGR